MLVILLDSRKSSSFRALRRLAPRWCFLSVLVPLCKFKRGVTCVLGNVSRTVL